MGKDTFDPGALEQMRFIDWLAGTIADRAEGAGDLQFCQQSFDVQPVHLLGSFAVDHFNYGLNNQLSIPLARPDELPDLLRYVLKGSGGHLLRRPDGSLAFKVLPGLAPITEATLRISGWRTRPNVLPPDWATFIILQPDSAHPNPGPKP